MRYTMLALLAAVLCAPIVGCESHTKETDKTNPITGTHTHEKESMSDTH